MKEQIEQNSIQEQFSLMLKNEGLPDYKVSLNYPILELTGSIYDPIIPFVVIRDSIGEGLMMLISYLKDPNLEKRLEEFWGG